MMEQRRALTIPFSVTKDNLMENPLRIPMACFSSEKLERQVSWTAFAGCKLRRSSQHKNGSVMMDYGNAAMISLEMNRPASVTCAMTEERRRSGDELSWRNVHTLSLSHIRRKPLLLLTDVLKTEPGKAYVERMRKGLAPESSRKRELGRRRTPVQSYSEKSPVTESRSNGRKRSTPRGRHKTPPQPSKRSSLRRRTQSATDEGDKDTEKVKNDEDCEDEEEDKFAEVVDCGLSVSWEPSEDTASRDKFSPVKDQRTEPEEDVQHSTRRKRKDPVSQCNGTSTPKRHRGSVLRLTGGDGEGESAADCPGETFQQADPENNIVQFTVGGDDQTPTPSLTSGDVVKSPERSSAPSADSTAEATASEPIVLSSDDEESGNISRRIQMTHRRVTLGDTVIRGLSSLKAAPRRTDISNMQNNEVLRVAKDVRDLVTAPSHCDDDYSRIEVAFSTLHCGGYHGKANGDVMIEREKIVIPLQDASEEMEVLLSFDRKELRRYSVWEQYELEEKEFCFVDDEDPYPAAVLLFFVSESAAAAVHQDLRQLGFERNAATKEGKASPFILLTMSCPLEGINGALLRSVLEIECLNKESIELMSRTGLDSHLLFMLGVIDSVLNEEDRGSSPSDGHNSPAAPAEPEVESPEDSQVVEADISPIVDQETSPAIELETSPTLDQEPSPTLDQEPSPTLDQEPSPTLDQEPSPTLDQEPSPTLDQEPSPTLDQEPSPTLDQEPSKILEPEASLALEPEASLALEQKASLALEPEASLALEPEASLALEPEASLALEPEASLVLEPDTFLALEQKASLALEQEVSPALEPEASLSVEPKTVPALEPETTQEEETSNVKPTEDLKDKEAQHPPCQKKQELAPAYTLCHRRNKGSYSVSLCKPDSKWTKYKHLGLTRRLIQFPPPPQKGGITVTMEDLQCLDSGQFLNDVIIDFYLKYLLQNAPASVAERTHIFSSFFYKQLTRRDNASEGSSNEACQRQRRHQRVKTWTRHVDIFNKDFLFVPVNQEAHWYLVVICFPGLDEPGFEDWAGPKSQAEESQSEEAQGSKRSNDAADRPPSLSRSNTANTQAERAAENSTKDFTYCPVNCTELTCQAKTVCKRPCILIMDSLKLSLHERVFKLLRDYLQSEWEVRRGSSREFSPDQMKGSHCRVPLQDNSSDCGLYLLQYVESFLKDPVVHFELPLSLERWFPRQQVRRKRDDIRDLILYLYRLHNLDLRHVKLPSF